MSKRKNQKRLGYAVTDIEGKYLVSDVSSRSKAREDAKDLNESFPTDHHIVVEIWTCA